MARSRAQTQICMLAVSMLPRRAGRKGWCPGPMGRGWELSISCQESELFEPWIWPSKLGILRRYYLTAFLSFDICFFHHSPLLGEREYLGIPLYPQWVSHCLLNDPLKLSSHICKMLSVIISPISELWKRTTTKNVNCLDQCLALIPLLYQGCQGQMFACTELDDPSSTHHASLNPRVSWTWPPVSIPLQ